MVLPALAAAEQLAAEKIRCTVVNCRFLKPYDREVFEEVARSHPLLLSVEEGQVSNGFGAFMARELDALSLPHRPRMFSMGVPDAFVEHGARKALLAAVGLDAVGIAARVRELSRVGEGTPVP